MNGAPGVGVEKVLIKENRVPQARTRSGDLAARVEAVAEKVHPVQSARPQRLKARSNEAFTAALKRCATQTTRDRGEFFRNLWNPCPSRFSFKWVSAKAPWVRRRRRLPNRVDAELLTGNGREKRDDVSLNFDLARFSGLHH
jgi:hypothetical protein